MIRRFALDVRHPLNSTRRALELAGLIRTASLSPNPDAPTRELFLEYSRLARAQGFDRLYVILSFDCDTPEDIPAAEQLDAWLRARNIPATYAVPGAMLQQGSEVYRRIADTGAEFINHGALPHAEWRDGRYWSVTFYHEMSPAEVRADIRRGHEIVQQVVGKTPVGFRAPHFGLFQLPEQRTILYSALRELHYQYSTSTMPELAYQSGPVIDVNGLCEIPLSGSYASPLQILDSWGHVESPFHPVAKDEYADLFIQTVERLLALNVCGVLNYYVDPAHVQLSPAFYRAMEFLIERNVPSIQYGQLLEIAKGK